MFNKLNTKQSNVDKLRKSGLFPEEYLEKYSQEERELSELTAQIEKENKKNDKVMGSLVNSLRKKGFTTLQIINTLQSGFTKDYFSQKSSL